MKTNAYALAASLIASLLLADPAAADWACTPSDEPGPVDVYRLRVEPFEQPYTFAMPLRVPLAQPRIEQVPVAQFLVTARETAAPGVGARGPLDLGGALAGAYAAATREPDKVKEYLYGEGRAAFDQACNEPLVAYMRRHNIRAHTVSFHAPSETDALAGARAIGACTVASGEGRQVEARLYVRQGSREVRRTHRPAGRLVARFILRASGQVADDQRRTLKVRYSLAAEPQLTAEQVPDDVPPHIARAVAASYHERVARQVAGIVDDLNGRDPHLDQGQQAEVCSGDGGRTTEAMPFQYFRDQASADLTVVATRHHVINQPLGDRCGEIDCDCANLEAGLLTRGWRSACRSEQSSAIAHCRATGQIRRCHMVGPNPRYPE